MVKTTECVKLGCAYSLGKTFSPGKTQAAFRDKLQELVDNRFMGYLKEIEVTTSDQRVRDSDEPEVKTKGLAQKLGAQVERVVGFIPGAIKQLKTGYHISVRTKKTSVTRRHKAYFAPELIEEMNKTCIDTGGYPMINGSPVTAKTMQDWSACPFPLEKIEDDAVEIGLQSSTRRVSPPESTPSARSRGGSLVEMANEKFEAFNKSSPKCISALQDVNWRWGIGDQQGALGVAHEAVDETGRTCNIPKPLTGETMDARSSMLAFKNLTALYGKE